MTTNNDDDNDKKKKKKTTITGRDDAEIRQDQQTALAQRRDKKKRQQQQQQQHPRRPPNHKPTTPVAKNQKKKPHTKKNDEDWTRSTRHLMLVLFSFVFLFGVVSFLSFLEWSTFFIRQEARSDLYNESTTDHANSTTPPRKRWAVMMIGSARTYASCRDSFLKNVLNHQTDSNSLLDVFTYSFPHKDNQCHIDSLGLHLLELDSTVFHLDNKVTITETGNSKQACKDRFIRQQVEHLDLMEGYAKQHDIQYDYVLYTRPDLLYTLPLNLSLLEKELEKHRSHSGWFSPQCCKFRGLCDRLAAATWEDLSRMIRSSEAWSTNAKNLIGEAAFQERSEFAGLVNHFDLPDGSYGFATLRHNNTRSHCRGYNATEEFENFSPDNVCNFHKEKRLTQHLTEHPVACSMMNDSFCKGERFF